MDGSSTKSPGFRAIQAVWEFVVHSPYSLWVAVGVGLAARIVANVLFADWVDPSSMDAQNYLRIARNLAEGRGFVLWNQPTSFVAPVYPAFLAAVLGLSGGALWIVNFIQILLGAGTILFTYGIGCLIMDRPASRVAAWFISLHPELIGLTAFIYSETLFIFLLYISVFFILRSVKDAHWKQALFGGAFLGLTTLCRGTLLYWPVVVLVLLWMIVRPSPRRAILCLVISGIAMAVVIAPWTYRNFKTFGVFLPVATGLGDVFWTGNYLPFDGEFRYQETQEKIRAIVGDVDFITRDRILIRETLNSIKEQPLASLWLMIRKVGRFWFRVYNAVPQGSPRTTNWAIFLPLAVTHYAILVLGLVGVRGVRWRDALWVVLLSLLLYYTAIHAVTLAVPRYRQPLIPLLSILAARGLLQIRKRIR